MLEPKAPAFSEIINTTLRHSLSREGLLRAVPSLALIMIAGIVAPGASPGVWSWVGVIAAAAAAWMAVTLLGRLRPPASDDDDGPITLVIAASLLGFALVLSAIFSALTFIFAIVILALVTLYLASRVSISNIVFSILVSTLLPFWVWSAFHAWDRWLLMLVLTGVVGLVALEHALRSDLVDDGQRERYASWIGVVAVAAMLLVTAMAIDAELAWISIGCIAILAFAAFDFSPLRRSIEDRLPGVVLPGLSLLSLVLAWLLAL